eukprot:s12878_g1.t1
MWPTSVRQLIDYSNERYRNECGKTVLNGFQASLAVPTSVRQLIDYSNERYRNECGKTVLNGFQASLAVLEQVGKVAEPDRLSNDVTWQAHLKSLTADLVSEQRPVQQAPMLTVA